MDNVKLTPLLIELQIIYTTGALLCTVQNSNIIKVKKHYTLIIESAL